MKSLHSYVRVQTLKVPELHEWKQMAKIEEN
jgi:hypothetical protein